MYSKGCEEYLAASLGSGCCEERRGGWRSFLSWTRFWLFGCWFGFWRLVFVVCVWSFGYLGGDLEIGYFLFMSYLWIGYTVIKWGVWVRLGWLGREISREVVLEFLWGYIVIC